MITDTARKKLKQICQDCSDHRGVTILKRQTSRATLTGVLLGGFTMKIGELVLPVVYGARPDHAVPKLLGYITGLGATITVNIFYERLGTWITEAEELANEIVHDAEVEERTVEEKIEEINQRLDSRVRTRGRVEDKSSLLRGRVGKN